MSEELKPCPFCGDRLKSDGPDSDFYTHPKSECHFSEWEFPCMSGDNLEKWNRRAASTRTASDTRTAAESDCDCGCNDPVASDALGMVKFLAYRFEHAGVSELVAKKYARDCRAILAAGEAECNAALGRAAPASQHDAEISVLDAAHKLICSHIKYGPLPGNGCDETAQRNGLVLAANMIAGMFRTASTDAATRSRAEGGNTKKNPADAESAEGGAVLSRSIPQSAEVDVEAERILFEASRKARTDLCKKRDVYSNPVVQACWETWLAARTQADAGKAGHE